MKQRMTEEDRDNKVAQVRSRSARDRDLIVKSIQQQPGVIPELATRINTLIEAGMADDSDGTAAVLDAMIASLASITLDGIVCDLSDEFCKEES